MHQASRQDEPAPWLRISRYSVIGAAFLLMGSLCAQDGEMLFDFDGDFDLSKVAARSVKATREQGALKLAFIPQESWPGVTLKAPKGKWDLSTWRELSLDVTNLGQHQMSICCRVDNPGADGRKNCVTGHVELGPGKKGRLCVDLPSSPFKVSEQIFGMRGTPAGSGVLDTSNVIQLIIFLPKPKQDHVALVDNIRVQGKVRPVEVKTFFPFIDKMGQFIHKDWPGKTKNVEDLKQQIKHEAEDLAKHPGPPDRTKWGGWQKGPKLKATGFFRPHKHEGKWWLVDPDGHLFWSHGIDCVNYWAITPITGREKYFADLPKKGSPLAQFYGKGNWAPRGYYKGKGPYRKYDFRAANLFRKYGKDWKEAFAEITHRRLRSWGFNSIGNWSSGEIYLKRDTPYTVAIHFGGPVIEGNKGFWHKFHDPFHPGFRAALRKRLDREKGKSGGDPWCIGYFVENELSWGSDLSLAKASLESPPEQAAKRAFVEDLKKKYGDIGKLNAKWQTQHASWDALHQAKASPKGDAAGEDLRAFAVRIAEEYFRIVREEVKRIAPKNMYLGCRFAWANNTAVEAAAKYCDVICYNLYRETIDHFKLPLELDRPVIVGEFHFGALDRGMFHTGLRRARDQKERAWKYTRYVTGALKNPQIVGTHWFQYGDQATTGRGDGENYQIGFLDICDKPYAETVEAARAIGKVMYATRAGK